MLIDSYENCLFYEGINLIFKYDSWRESRTSSIFMFPYQKREYDSSPKRFFYFCRAGVEDVKPFDDIKKYDEPFCYWKYKECHQCVKEEDTEDVIGKCSFVNALNKIANGISESIHKRMLLDLELLPYYHLHESIKTFPVGVYDRIIDLIAEYFTVDSFLTDIDYGIRNRIKVRIGKATVMMCMMRSSCAYKELVKNF